MKRGFNYIKQKNRHFKSGFAFLIPIIILVMIIAIVLIGASCAGFVGGRQGTAHTGKMLTDETTGGGVDCSGIKFNSTYYPWVKDAAGKYMKGDEAALIAMIQIESGWRVDAKNPGSSAAGLGQFITSTARGYAEFVGGNDKHGTTWTPGKLYDSPSSHDDDARFDAKRSIYAAARYIGGLIGRYGSVGAAYQEGYHGYCKDMGNPSCVKQLNEAKLGRARLEKYYNELKNKGCTVTDGGSGGAASGAGCNNVPVYLQGANPWGTQSYGCGSTTVKSSGCGVSASAMVLKFYGKNVDPGLLAKLSLINGYRVCNGGTSHAFFPFVAKKYGLKNENAISWSRAMTLLKQGKPVIASGKGPIPFSSGGHYIVLTCLNSDGTISVNDSAGGRHPKSAKYPISLIKSYQHFLTAIYP